MITSWPCFQFTGVATLCLAVSWQESRSRRTVAQLSASRAAETLPTRRELAAALVGAKLARMDAALERRDVKAAVHAWHEAYAAAITARIVDGGPGAPILLSSRSTGPSVTLRGRCAP